MFRGYSGDRIALRIITSKPTRLPRPSSSFGRASSGFPLIHLVDCGILDRLISVDMTTRAVSGRALGILRS